MVIDGCVCVGQHWVAVETRRKPAGRPVTGRGAARRRPSIHCQRHRQRGCRQRSWPSTRPAARCRRTRPPQRRRCSSTPWSTPSLPWWRTKCSMTPPPRKDRPVSVIRTTTRWRSSRRPAPVRCWSAKILHRSWSPSTLPPPPVLPPPPPLLPPPPPPPSVRPMHRISKCWHSYDPLFSGRHGQRVSSSYSRLNQLPSLAVSSFSTLVLQLPYTSHPHLLLTASSAGSATQWHRMPPPPHHPAESNSARSWLLV